MLCKTPSKVTSRRYIVLSLFSDLSLICSWFTEKNINIHWIFSKIYMNEILMVGKSKWKLYFYNQIRLKFLRSNFENCNYFRQKVFFQLYLVLFQIVSTFVLFSRGFPIIPNSSAFSNIQKVIMVEKMNAMNKKMYLYMVHCEMKDHFI